MSVGEANVIFNDITAERLRYFNECMQSLRLLFPVEPAASNVDFIMHLSLLCKEIASSKRLISMMYNDIYKRFCDLSYDYIVCDLVNITIYNCEIIKKLINNENHTECLERFKEIIAITSGINAGEITMQPIQPQQFPIQPQQFPMQMRVSGKQVLQQFPMQPQAFMPVAIHTTTPKSTLKNRSYMQKIQKNAVATGVDAEGIPNWFNADLSQFHNFFFNSIYNYIPRKYMATTKCTKIRRLLNCIDNIAGLNLKNVINSRIAKRTVRGLCYALEPYTEKLTTAFTSLIIDGHISFMLNDDYCVVILKHFDGINTKYYNITNDLSFTIDDAANGAANATGNNVVCYVNCNA